MSADSADAPLRGTALKRFNRAGRRAWREQPRRLAFVLEHVSFAVNVGSLFRIADACDAELVALVGSTPLPDDSPTIRKVGRGRHRRVEWAHFEDVPQALETLHGRGFRSYAVEITAAARAYHEVEFAERSAFVLGNEEHGITRDALAACQEAVYLPMLGKGASLNVHVAGAVVAYRALFP
jgi:tRNA (guanosine-2'-O-)-methyltransferase